MHPRGRTRDQHARRIAQHVEPQPDAVGQASREHASGRDTNVDDESGEVNAVERSSQRIQGAHFVGNPKRTTARQRQSKIGMRSCRVCRDFR